MTARRARCIGEAMREHRIGMNRPGGGTPSGPDDDTDPDLRRRTNQPAPMRATPDAMQSTVGDDSEDKTRDLPPELIGGPIPRIPASRRPRLIAIGTVVALAVLLVTSIFLATRGSGSGVLGTGPAFEGCGDNTPCKVADSYLADYVAGKYDDLYGFISQQTIKQFD